MSQEPDREEAPDWRRGETYVYTEMLTRVGWAWEFLRRNPAFQADLNCRPAPSSEEVSERSDLKRWGICFCGCRGAPGIKDKGVLGSTTMCPCSATHAQ